MKSAKTKLYILMFGMIALTISGIALRTIALRVSFDAEIGYFQDGPLATLCYIITALAVLMPLVMSIIIPKGTLTSTWPDLQNNAVAILPMIALLVCGILPKVLPTLATTQSVLADIIVVTSLLASGYFLLTLIPRIRQYAPSVLNVVGFGVIFWGLSALSETYFDLFTTMNSPIKVMLQFSFLSVALMITAELRFRLSKALPRLAVAIHGVAMHLCLTAGFSTLVATLLYKDSIPTKHTLYATTLLALGVYAAFRLFTYLIAQLHPVPVQTTPDETAVVSTSDESTTSEDMPQNIPEEDI